MVMDFGVSRDCELVEMERSQIGSVCVCGGWGDGQRRLEQLAEPLPPQTQNRR